MEVLHGMSSMQKVCIGWAEVERSCSSIACKIVDDGVRVGCILAVARGGIVPSVIMAGMLSVEDLLFIRTRHYDGMSMNDHVDIEFITGLEEIHARMDLCRREGRIMLVMDDIADTGLTMSTITRILDCKDSVRTATLYMKPRSRFRPDYYAGLCRDDEWIVFPWEYQIRAATTD